jgi:hypothetical protein
MKVHLLAGVLCCAALLCAAAADDKKPAPDFAKLMEAYAKASTPGEHHKRLEPLVGSWTYKGKFWMDPSAPPSEQTGTAERKWILGGRFLHEEYKSSDGHSFHGIGVTGYDNVRKKYTSAWIDSMTTAITQTFGTADESGKVFTFSKEDIDPVSGEAFKSRDVLTIESNDRHSVVVYKILPDGKELKVMEIVQERKK